MLACYQQTTLDLLPTVFCCLSPGELLYWPLGVGSQFCVDLVLMIGVRK